MFGMIGTAYEMATATAEESPLVPTEERAQSSSRAVNLVVALVVGALMAAFLLPIAINELEGVDTSSWSDGAASLWGVLSVLVVLAIFLYFTRVATDSA